MSVSLITGDVNADHLAKVLSASSLHCKSYCSSLYSLSTLVLVLPFLKIYFLCVNLFLKECLCH